MVFGMMRPERRKYIPEYGKKYEIGDLGRVFSKGCEMSVVQGRFINLCKDGVVKRMKIAYLVARAFLLNEEGRPYVRHKDGNPENNRVENLEWCEFEEKFTRGPKPKYQHRIIQYMVEDGICVGRYDGIDEAVERSGCSKVQIMRSLRENGAHTRNGYYFKFE